MGAAARDQRARRRVDPEVRDVAGDPAGDAAQRQAPRHEGKGGRLLPDRGSPVRAGDPPGGDGSGPDQGVELRLGRPPGDVQLSGLHDRGGVAQASARQVDQRAREAGRQLPAAPACGRPDAPLGQPARWHPRPRWAWHRPRPVPRPGADRHPPTRRPQRPAERRLPGGLVPAEGARDSAPLRQGGLEVPGVPGARPGRARPGVDSRERRVPVRQRPARGDDVVPRPHARDDAPQRLRGAGRLLPAARRAPGRGRRDAARPGAGTRRPAGTGVLRDPARDPGPLLHRRGRALLPGQPRLLRGARSVPAADPVLGRPRLRRPERRRADLEPGVLRQRDRGQRANLAQARGAAAAVPPPPPERLQLALPDPAAGERAAVLADRQRGRLPAAAGRAPRGPARPGRARGRDRRLHERAGRHARFAC